MNYTNPTWRKYRSCVNYTNPTWRKYTFCVNYTNPTLILSRNLGPMCTTPVLHCFGIGNLRFGPVSLFIASFHFPPCPPSDDLHLYSAGSQLTASLDSRPSGRPADQSVSKCTRSYVYIQENDGGFRGAFNATKISQARPIISQYANFQLPAMHISTFKVCIDMLWMLYRSLYVYMYNENLYTVPVLKGNILCLSQLYSILLVSRLT